MQYQVKIERYNPTTQEKYFQTYNVDLDEKLTIIEVLEHIKEHIDATLTYRAFCKSAICGSCAMVVNGLSKLTCKLNAVENLIDGVLEIAPLKQFDVIKDLVVDQDKGFNLLKKAQTFMIPKTPPKNSEFLIDPKEEASYDKQTECILCMSCFSDCPAVESDENYFGPFIFSKILRFVNDSRDSIQTQRIDNTMQGNIFSCVECQACILACPKGLAPQFDIKNLQTKAMAQGHQNPNQMSFGNFGSGFDDFGGFNPNGF
jgi:succinate dehydrogenase / fumarate reductase iron-sulfur subunit